MILCQAGTGVPTSMPTPPTTPPQQQANGQRGATDGAGRGEAPQTVTPEPEPELLNPTPLTLGPEPELLIPEPELLIATPQKPPSVVAPLAGIPSAISAAHDVVRWHPTRLDQLGWLAGRTRARGCVGAWVRALRLGSEGRGSGIVHRLPSSPRSASRYAVEGAILAVWHADWTLQNVADPMTHA